MRSRVIDLACGLIYYVMLDSARLPCCAKRIIHESNFDSAIISLVMGCVGCGHGTEGVREGG